MAHLVLKYVGNGRYLAGWPASDLSDEDVAARAAERQIPADEYVAAALAVQGMYQLAGKGKQDFAEVAEEAAEAKTEAKAAEAPRKK